LGQLHSVFKQECERLATFEKRGLGQWRVRVRKHGYPDVSRTFDKRSKAERWAKKTEMDDMEFVSRKEAQRTTLKKLLERYRDEITAQKKGAVNETYQINKMLRHPICKCTLSTLTLVDIAAYRNQRLKTVSPSSVYRELDIISHAINITINSRAGGFTQCN